MKRPLATALTAVLILAGCSSTQTSATDAATSASSLPATTAALTDTGSTGSDEPATDTGNQEAGEGKDSDGTSGNSAVENSDSGNSATSSPPSSLVDLDARSRTPDTPSRFTVAYYGDSLAASAQEWVGTFIERGGRLEFRPGTFPGSAVCDWYPRFDEDLATLDLWAVVLFFTNNTFSPCMKNADGSDLTEQEAIDKFHADLGDVIDRFIDAGATVYLPTIPTSRGELVLGINPSEQLNAVFADLASSRDHAVVVDAGRAVLDADGNYAETLPCLPYEPCTGGVNADGVPVNLVREPDGVHFCSGGYGPDVPIETDTCPTWSSGAFRYAGALTAPIIAAAQAEWVADNPPSAVPDQVVPAEPTN